MILDVSCARSFGESLSLDFVSDGSSYFRFIVFKKMKNRWYNKTLCHISIRARPELLGSGWITEKSSSEISKHKFAPVRSVIRYSRRINGIVLLSLVFELLLLFYILRAGEAIHVVIARQIA